MGEEEPDEPITRLSMFVPGAQPSVAAWNTALAGAGLRIEDKQLLGTGLEHAPQVHVFEEKDGFAHHFSYGTVSADVLAKVADARVGLMVMWPIDLRDGRAQIVSTIEHLRDAGAIGVQFGESKLGWDVERWLEMFSSDNPAMWHAGAVMFVGSGESIQSVGMHMFSMPDVRIAVDGDRGAAHHLASILDIYQLADDPDLRSGHTFAPNAKTPRRVLQRWPDANYPRYHECNNPYGVWHVGPPGSSALKVPEMQPVFVPPLHAMFTIAEQRAGAHLTREQAIAIRDEAPCIEMEPRDARKLERSRGYADIDPELCWEQWQVLRDSTPEDKD